MEFGAPTLQKKPDEQPGNGDRNRDRNRDYYQGEEYARKYIERTFASPYTDYKNRTLSEVAKNIGAHCVLDLGCNVSPTIKTEGSLRYLMEQKGIKYVGMDLSFPYFDKRFAISSGVAQSSTYEKIDGIVGNMLNIPIKDSSIELMTCADVLEHVSDPDRAFEEISRVLSEEGRALIVLPSMYKLDIADYPHIEDRRKSSHESKLTVSEWAQKWGNADLEIDYDKSRPLGVASGLSYLAWLSDDFVPERKQLRSKETYSTEAELHNNAKRILSKYDSVIDEIFLSDQKTASDVSSSLQAGDIKNGFKILKNIINTVEMSEDERELCNEFFDSVLEMEFDDERISKLRAIFASHANPLLLMGNSMLIVLKKR